MTKSTKLINKILNNKIIRLVIAICLFIMAIVLESILDFIIYMLYFIIFVELSNIIAEMIIRKHLQMRYIIDTFIIILLRELVVSVSKIQNSNSTYHSFVDFISSNSYINILSYAVVIVFLFFIKYITLKLSILKRNNGLENDENTFIS